MQVLLDPSPRKNGNKQSNGPETSWKVQFPYPLPNCVFVAESSEFRECGSATEALKRVNNIMCGETGQGQKTTATTDYTDYTDLEPETRDWEKRGTALTAEDAEGRGGQKRRNDSLSSCLCGLILPFSRFTFTHFPMREPPSILLPKFVALFVNKKFLDHPSPIIHHMRQDVGLTHA